MVFEPSESVITGSAHTNYVMSGTFRIYQGQFSLRLVNRLPVQMTECHGVIGATARLIGVYHTECFGRDSCGQNSGNDICSELCNSRFLEPYGVPAKRPDHATAHFTIGNGQCLVYREVEGSPVMKIDDQRTEFAPN